MTAKFNLAPEVYQTSQRNKRLRRTATSIGIVVNAVAVGLIILGLVVIGGQKIAIAALQSQINSRQEKVKTYADLPDAVTAQQHLKSLNQLSSQQVYFSSFFKVLQNVLPQGVTASDVTVGNDGSLQISGNASTYALVTKFAKALQAYNVTVGPNASATQKPFFSDVQLSSVSSQSNSAGGGAIGFKIQATMSSEVTTNGH